MTTTLIPLGAVAATSLPAGSEPTAAVVDGVLTWGIPAGADGADGASAYEVAVAAGFVGPEAAWLASLKGDEGDAAPLPAITATATTGAPGTAAAASVSGTYPDLSLDLTIPEGDPGNPGPANSLAIGTVTTGAAGSSAAATITGDAPSQTLNLTIPRGDTGADGGSRAAVWLAGVWSDYISCPDSAALDITGDIDVRIRCSFDAWNVGAIRELVNKWGSAGQRSWYLREYAGTLAFGWSPDGTAEISASTGVATVSWTATPNAVGWIRATLDVDTGSGHTVKLYESTDGITWTTIATVSNATATSVFASTANVNMGSGAGGRYLALEIRNGIGGAIAGAWKALGSLDKFRDPAGGIWTVNGNAAVMEV